MKAKHLFLAAIATLALSCGSSKMNLNEFKIDPNMKEITIDDAFQKTQVGTLMIDVREVEEVNEVAYNVLNVKNIPLSELPSRYKEIPKDAEVIIACRSGKRSAKATSFLMSQGYQNVVSMAGGITGWMNERHSVIKGNK